MRLEGIGNCVPDGDFRGINGIVLDAVGTLIEPNSSVSQVYADAAMRQGVAIDRSRVKSRFAAQFAQDETDELRGPLSTSEDVERRRWRRIVGACLPEVPHPDRAFAELWDHFADAAHWRVFPDVAPTALRLREAGFQLAVASNFDARLRPVLLGLKELADWAGTPVISSEVGYRKPHPTFYAAACERLGLPRGGILFVGDDVQNDVLGPIRAGLRAILIDRNPKDGGEVPSLPSLESLADILVSRIPAAH